MIDVELFERGQPPEYNSARPCRRQLLDYINNNWKRSPARVQLIVVDNPSRKPRFDTLLQSERLHDKNVIPVTLEELLEGRPGFDHQSVGAIIFVDGSEKHNHKLPMMMRIFFTKMISVRFINGLMPI